MFEEKALTVSAKGHGRFGAQRSFYANAETYDPDYEAAETSDYAYYQAAESYEPNYYDPDADWDDWNNQYWGEEEEDEPWNEAQEQPPDETLLRLQEEQSEMEKQRQELQAMLSETDRNLVEARRAVAAAAKDRGWTGSVQQRQPKSTSTFPWQKGKGNGKQNGGRGSFQNHWMQGKGKGKPKGRNGFGKGFGGRHNNTFHMLSVDLPPEEMLFNPVQTSSSSDHSLPTESLIDTGATATAGGKNAVRDLCKALVTARPDLKIDIHEQSRPWFRFGDGRWGRALYYTG